MSLYVLDTDTLQLFQDKNPLVVERILAATPSCRPLFHEPCG